MRQRISIACAIVHSPPVLILDEPTTGLDVYSRRLVIDTVRHMNREGSTILLTTHNIEEANALCSTISIINKGKIVATGSPEKLKKTFDTSRYVEISFDRPVGTRPVFSARDHPGGAMGGQVAGLHGRPGPGGEAHCFRGRAGAPDDRLHRHLEPDA